MSSFLVATPRSAGKRALSFIMDSMEGVVRSFPPIREERLWSEDAVGSSPPDGRLPGFLKLPRELRDIVRDEPSYARMKLLTASRSMVMSSLYQTVAATAACALKDDI